MAAIRRSFGIFGTVINLKFPSIAATRCPRYCLKGFSCTTGRKGLEEFFPPGVYESGGPAPKEVKTGRRWHASDLRQKSYNDLHKLWYVLLKEMNMLQTVMAEAKRLQVPMPNPERMKKVQKSMGMIKQVIGERELAVKRLDALGYEPKFQEDASILMENSQKEKEDLLKGSNVLIDKNSANNEQSPVTEGRVDKVSSEDKTAKQSNFSMT